MNLKPLKKIIVKPEPIHLILLGIGVLVVVIFFIQYSYGKKEKIAVEYQDLPQTAEIDKRKNKVEAARLGETDPSMRLSARVLEANGIATGLLQYCLYRNFVQNNSVPRNLGELLNEYQSSELKAPYIKKITANGQIVTERSAFFVQYSSKPLMISILSGVSNYQVDGSVFVLRTPDNSFQNNSDPKIKTTQLATLYVAPMAKDGAIPLPFAVADEYRKAGWSVEPLRLNDVSPEKLNQINQLMKEVK